MGSLEMGKEREGGEEEREDGGMMKRPSRSGPGPRVIEAVLRCGVCTE